MKELIIDPPIPFVLPLDAPATICVVGAGGTGSHILQSLARLCHHVREQGAPPTTIAVIDGDRVEPKNVGRQLFSPADVGVNKAVALAARFNAVFGLRINAIDQMASKTLLDQVGSSFGYGGLNILVGAVDNAGARRLLHDALQRGRFRLWLDCGNEAVAGDVSVGTVTTHEKLAGCLGLGGICTALPAPSLLYPNLVEEPPKPKRQRLDCAAAVQANEQSLMVNQAIAAVAGQYLYQLVVERRITTCSTTISLAGLSMRSTPITATALAQATGVDIATLTRAPLKKGRAA